MIDYDPHRWSHHLFDIRGSLVRQILPRTGLCMAASVIWVVLIRNYGLGLAIPATLHSLIGPALALLLVFRTNASYDRFWEGRKLWGNMVNDCRNLARQSRGFFGKDSEAHREFLGWTQLFPILSMRKLRGQVDPATLSLPSLASKALKESHLVQVLRSSSPPLSATARMSELLLAHTNRESWPLTLAIENAIARLIDSIGGCERIHKTPLPFAYVVHLRRALLLYCLSLPLALEGTLGWGTPFAVGLISYIFFGIEEIGVEIEDPFEEDPNDLPLERICETIETNVASMQFPRLDFNRLSD
jgi:putative membrane protein